MQGSTAETNVYEKRLAQEAWQMAKDEAYGRPYCNWLYNERSLTAFLELLAKHSLILEDLKLRQEDVDKVRLFGYLNAARECWRLVFKNDSGVTPAGRLRKMDEQLQKVGKTRADIGLFEISEVWVDQVPDLEMALMNPGRTKYVHHRWVPGAKEPLEVFAYNPETRTFLRK
jgi:hypothetical protein